MPTQGFEASYIPHCSATATTQGHRCAFTAKSKGAIKLLLHNNSLFSHGLQARGIISIESGTQPEEKYRPIKTRMDR
jgi:hypothetical protein